MEDDEPQIIIPEQQQGINAEDIRKIFRCKCEDQALPNIKEREDRFVDLIKKSCNGLVFSLKEHGLGDKSGKAIYDALKNNTTYPILELFGNVFRDQGTCEIAKLLSCNSTIIRLDLRSNDIGAKGAEAIFKELTNNSSLTSLDLSGLSGINRNHISLKGAKALFYCLKAQTTVLYELNLGSNGLGEEGIRLLCQGLKHNQTIEKLTLSSNNMGVKGCEYLSKVLNKTKISELDIERNSIGDKGLSYFISSTNLGSNDSFATGNENEEEEDKEFEDEYEKEEDRVKKSRAEAEIILPLLRIKKLNISENKISAAGFHNFCINWLEALQCSIVELKCDTNKFGDEGAKSIANSLEFNKTIEKLYLSKNGIGKDGGKAIAYSMKKNSSVIYLDLSSNLLEEDTARALANSLEKNDTLEVLKLSDNRIPDEGGVPLAKMLASNKSLKKFCIKQNELNEETGNALADVLRQYNRQILKMDFSYNNFTFKNYSVINEALARNLMEHKQNEKNRLIEEIEAMSIHKTTFYGLLDQIEKIESKIKEYEDMHNDESRNIKQGIIQHESDMIHLSEVLETRKTEKHDLVQKTEDEENDFHENEKQILSKNKEFMKNIEDINKEMQNLKNTIEEVTKEFDFATQELNKEKDPLLAELQKEESEIAVIDKRIADVVDETNNTKLKAKIIGDIKKKLKKK